MMRNRQRKDQAKFQDYGALPDSTTGCRQWGIKERSASSQYKKLPAAMDSNILFIMKYNPLRWLVT